MLEQPCHILLFSCLNLFSKCQIETFRCATKLWLLARFESLTSDQAVTGCFCVLLTFIPRHSEVVVTRSRLSQNQHKTIWGVTLSHSMDENKYHKEKPLYRLRGVWNCFFKFTAN